MEQEKDQNTTYRYSFLFYVQNMSASNSSSIFRDFFDNMHNSNNSTQPNINLKNLEISS